MKNNVIPFPDNKQAAHLAGKAHCISCAHEWAAVVEIGDTIPPLECPSCKAMKGILTNCVSFTDEEHWTCKCGNQFFCVTETKTYCPLCGRIHTWD